MESSLIQSLADAGIAGLAILMFLMWWYDRRDREKKDQEYRLVLTNHLSSMIARENDNREKDIASREHLTETLTRLDETVKTFGTGCQETQELLQNTAIELKSDVKHLENAFKELKE